MRKNKVLIIGPFPNPISGMSFANEVTYNGLKSRGYTVKKIDFKTSSKEIDDAQGKINLEKLLLVFKYFQAYKIFSVDRVYITIGLTFYGLIKYLPFIIISTLINKPIIFHSHGNYLHKEYENLKGFKKKWFKKTLNLFDRGIVLSEILKQNLVSFYPEEKLYIVYNFVEESERLYYKERQKNKLYSPLKLLFLSNLIEDKGPNVLLDALQIMQNRGHIIEASFAGNIPKGNQKVLDVMEKLPYVNYLGVLQFNEKKEAFLEHNIFSLPTFYPMEGQPISILEAMASGNIIITTQHAGIPDICNEENAEFVKENDVESIVEVLDKLLQQPEIIRKKGEYNYLQSIERFTEDHYLDGIEQALQPY